MDLLKTILCLPYRTPERINVTIHPGGNGFDIPFPFGTIVVPDTPDGYCISNGIKVYYIVLILKTNAVECINGS